MYKHWRDNEAQSDKYWRMIDQRIQLTEAAEHDEENEGEVEEHEQARQEVALEGLQLTYKVGVKVQNSSLV